MSGEVEFGYSRFACRLNMSAESFAARSIRRRIVRSRKIDRLCSNSVPIGCIDTHPESALTFGVGAGMRTVTSANRPIEDWGKLLGDNAAASAILDRLLHRGHLLKFEGKSYRLKEASKRLALEKKKN